MKKVFWFFVLFFSFGFIGNAEALSPYKFVMNYDSQYVNNVMSSDKINFINSLKSYIDSSTNRSDFEYVILVYTGSDNNNQVSVLFFKTLPYDRRLVLYDYVRTGYSSGIFLTRAGVPNSNGLTTYNLFSHYKLNFQPSFYDDFTSSDFTDNTINSNNVLNNFLSNPLNTLNNSNLTSAENIEVVSFSNNDISLYNSVSPNGISNILYYSSVNIYLSFGVNDNTDYFRPIDIIYDGITTSYSLGDRFYTYSDFSDGDYQVPINKVSDFGNNTYGFYNNFLSVHDIGVGNDIYNVAVICEQDKPFENGYCNLNVNDLLSYNSNINYFKKSALAFTQVFSTTETTGYLYNNKYYMYSFRILKPFVPNFSSIRLDTSDGIYEVPNANILSVKKYDGGSYTDYVVSFKIDNTNFSSSTNLNNILVLFGGTLESYYQPIPSTFNLGVYRSFKLQILNNSPTDTEIENFMFTNDLSSIDSAGSQNGFFTDNTFNTFGFSAIITAPFRFLYALEDYESCTDINLPFPYTNTNLQLKCVRNSIPNSVYPLISILQVVLSGFIGYRICVGTFKIIKELLDPNNYDIEVVDL